MKKLVAIWLILAGIAWFPDSVRALEDEKTDEEILENASAVLELRETVYRFEQDGTGTETAYLRYRIQNEQGRAELGQVFIPYQEKLSWVEIHFVRTIKPDGTAVEADIANPLEQTHPVNQFAPIFTDIRYKVIPVPGLQAGDVLEYKVTVHLTTPFKEGDFWFQHQAVTSVPSLEEIVVLDVPVDRPVTLHGTDEFAYAFEKKGKRGIHRWTFANPRGPERKFEETPAVQASSIARWEEVGEWFLGLQSDRGKVTEEIRETVNQITDTLETDREKLEAIFRYVSEEVRYVGISLGLGGYQAHPAIDIFENQYGDCKDKHTLLAAMLSATGIEARAVLLHSFAEVEEDVPSPAQFDHLITTVELDGERVWMDATLEVAPVGYLPRQWRGRKALLVLPGASRLVEMPEDSSIEELAKGRFTGAIDAGGNFRGRIDYEMRGTYDLIWRLAFRRANDEQIKAGLQFARPRSLWDAEVVNLESDDPSVHSGSYSFGYEIEKKRFLNPQKKDGRITLLTLILGQLPWRIPEKKEVESEKGESAGKESRAKQEGNLASVESAPGEDRGEPEEEDFDLGGPGRFEEKLEIGFDPVYELRLPAPVNEETDFARYLATYELKEGTLTVERRLEVLQAKLSPERRRDLERFGSAIKSDLKQRLFFERAEEFDVLAAAEGFTADELNEAGFEALRGRKPDLAQRLFSMATDKDPANKHAWNNLGRALIRLGRPLEAEEALRKQIEVSPEGRFAWNNLGRALARQGRNEEAVEAFRKQIAINSSDRWALANLADALAQLDRWAETEETYRTIVAKHGETATVLVDMGMAQLHLDKMEEARANFDKALELSNSAANYNNIAYSLAETGKELDLALRYASSAVARAEAELLSLTRAEEWKRGIRMQARLSAYLDTLGWVLYQQGEFVEALPLFESVLALQHAQTMAEHLAIVHGALGNEQEARKYFRRAVLLSFGRTVETPPGVDVSREGMQSPMSWEQIARELEKKGEKYRQIAFSGDRNALWPEDFPPPDEETIVVLACLVDSRGKVHDAARVQGSEAWAGHALESSGQLKFGRLSWGRAGIRLIRWAVFRFLPDGSVRIGEPTLPAPNSLEELNFD